MLRQLNLAVRIPQALLGLAFTVFGAIGLFHLVEMPPHEGLAAQYLGALSATYLMTLVKTVELSVGLALLANRFVPLALALLAPVSVNIVGFHTLIEPGQLALPVVLFALQGWLVWSYRGAYAGLLQVRASPSSTTEGRAPRAGAVELATK